MAVRTYTICRAEPEGAPAGQRHSVTQVSLGLDDAGYFQLVDGSYYSDWGDRRQDSSTYKGKYTESGGEIRCKSESVLKISFTSDHEMGTRELDEKVEPANEVFVFKRLDAESVECSVDFAGFKGGIMDTKTVPAGNQY